MKCPDCGSRLTELRMEGGDVSHRCPRCGGFLMDGWTINRLAAKQLELWRRIPVPVQWVSGGNGMCPLDGTLLARYVGEVMPMSIPALRCARCGKWWFPRDSLFEYKPAQEAKVNYFRLWGIASDLSGLILPVVTVAVLLGGVGVGVGLVKIRQQAQVSAGVGVSAFSATYLGGGRAVISFKSVQRVQVIEYRGGGERDWVKVVVEEQGGVYIVNLEALMREVRYEVRILGKVWEFETRRD